ncbi:TIGR03790 family protein [Thermodesulfobacteriota bacterium]
MSLKVSHLYKLFTICLLLLSWAGQSYGLEQTEVLVVANKAMPGSVDIARYYMKRRNIPESHLLSLSLSLEETISRNEYDQVLRLLVLKKLDNLRSEEAQITAIVLVYGVPLKIMPEPSELGEKEKTNKNAKVRSINDKASVDSELSLVKAGEYELDGWQKNPYFLGFQGIPTEITKDQTLLVSRLDGPDPKTVIRIIDDTLQAEKHELQGKAYFDARWPPPASQSSLSGYQFYDGSLHTAAEIANQRMEVIIDDDELFGVNCCPSASIYYGCYSLGNYIDSFDWQMGAIGYHIASSECSTLRDKTSSVWCMKMLEKGVSATIGPVFEPFVQGFPLPEIFFSHLLEGHMSLGESFLVSLPFPSWQMVLIGDPLYQRLVPQINFVERIFYRSCPSNNYLIGLEYKAKSRLYRAPF